MCDSVLLVLIALLRSIKMELKLFDSLNANINSEIHMSGSRHRAAELKRKDRELAMQEEANKRLALSDSVSTNAATASASTTQPFKTRSKPLIERARKAASEAFSLEVIQQKAKSEMVSLVVPRIEDCGSNANGVGTEAKRNGEVQPFYCRERKERELKYTAAGWKRDGYGRWFKDENVSLVLHAYAQTFCWKMLIENETELVLYSCHLDYLSVDISF